MAVTINAKGTSTTSFIVGKDGTTITAGGVISPPASTDLKIDLDVDQYMVVDAGTSGPSLITTTDDKDLHINPAVGGGQYLVLVGSRWPVADGTANQVLKTNGSGVLSWTSTGSGSVTDVSVVSANGFSGSVATSTSTPAITLSTTVTGVLKGNGTALSAAASGDITTALGYTPVNKAGDTMSGDLEITHTTNNLSGVSVTNPSTGTAASADIILINNAGKSAGLEITSSNYTNYANQAWLYTGGSVPLILSTGSSPQVTLDTTGRVGINASTSNLRLNQKFVVGNDGGNTYGGMGIHNYSSTVTTAGVFDFLRSASNTAGTGAALASGSDLGYLAWRGYTDSSVANIKDGAYILATTTEAWTTTSTPADLKIFTTVTGTTDPGERVRITSAGALLVGTTSTTLGDDTTSWFGANGNSGGLANMTVIHAPNNATSSWVLMGLYRGSSQIGSIQYNGTGTSFVTTSDVRLKENIADASSAGAKIDAMQVREFDFKTGGHIEHGFIAQELNAVAPEAVNVGGDDVNLQPWGVDYSKLVPLLVKEIQDLRSRVQDLNARVTLLELNG